MNKPPLRVAAFVLACVVAADAETVWTVYLRRAGPVRIGMTLQQARVALGDPSAALEAYPDDPAGVDGCTYLSSAALPDTIGLMFEQRRLVRVEIDERAIGKTGSGARVGDTEQQIKDLYPDRIRVEPNHYDPAAHYLIYDPRDASDKEYQILFETDGSQVITFRSGLAEAVGLVEGCS